jgi:hypothetical protein
MGHDGIIKVMREAPMSAFYSGAQYRSSACVADRPAERTYFQRMMMTISRDRCMHHCQWRFLKHIMGDAGVSA